MHIDIISIIPKLLESPFSHSILQRAQDKGIVKIEVHDLRKYGIGKHKQVDDYAYGGGAGMVMMVEPIAKCINDLKKKREYDEIIYMCPDGDLLNQKLANRYSLKKNLLILCGHYKGVDERVREHFITKEISIGNYVMSGGELAAAVFVDAVIRLIPGVISDESSALTDSFQDNLIAPPVYTRPEEYSRWKVPYVLLSGNTANVEKWREEKSIQNTQKRRPDLLKE